MKVYTKIIFDKNNNVIFEDCYNYEGKWTRLGIHYDFKSTKGAKLMEKKAKREKKLEERKKKRAQKQSKTAFAKDEEEDKTLPIDHVISLEDLTRPDKK